MGTQLNYDERPYFELRVQLRGNYHLLTPATGFYISVAGVLLEPAYDEEMSRSPGRRPSICPSTRDPSHAGF